MNLIFKNLRKRAAGPAEDAEPAKAEPVNEWTDPANIPYVFGTGNWDGFRRADISIEESLAEARRWAAQLRGVKRPWLCWNVDNDWCLVQQRQVREVGWTPLVGFDPRVGPPPLIPGAILVDFNERLRLPTMWLHFPLEFLFLYVEERMAYWHADCLLRPEKMRRYADLFAALPDGEMAAVKPRNSLREYFQPKSHRYWEVLGCSTVGASRSQFENGCGWWLNIRHHPSAPSSERAARASLHWECGVGIRYWKRRYGGIVRAIPESDIAEGHFTLIGRRDYKRASPVHFRRDLSKELSLNTDLTKACEQLGLAHLLATPT
jgi:hypothetical protein